jgi:uncharacterized protein
VVEAAITVPAEAVRRLAVTRQRLAGPLPSRVTGDTIVDVVRAVAYIQWDPVTIVAPSHLLSLWARLGGFRPELVERLLWTDKRLFEHWTPMASLVLTEDYPLYASMMQRYPDSLSHSWANHRTRAKRFLADHGALRVQVLRDLRGGPRTIGEFAAHHTTRRDEGEFTPNSDVATMLFHLLMRGEVMVVGRQGGQNRWGLTAEFLPDWVDRGAWSEPRFEREAVQRALRALGTGSAAEITYYFPRGRYETLDRTLRRLTADGILTRVRVEGMAGREERFILTSDLRALESIGSHGWTPRMTLLPPFDNLISSTKRTERLFGFHYVREQFLPAEKRRYRTYVLPILWGDRLIGRIDPRLDKAAGTLVVHAVHAEPGAPRDRDVGDQLARTITSLAQFVGATHVRYSEKVPSGWRTALTSGLAEDP